MKIIRQEDRSGKLLKGAFYVLSVPAAFDVDLDMGTSEDSSEWIVRRSALPNGEEAYAEVCVKYRAREECSLNRSHHVGTCGVSVNWTDLYGGSRVAEFVHDKTSQCVVATTKAAELLKNSDLKGLDIMPLPIRVNQSRLGAVPLSRLLFLGKECERPSRITVPEPNRCPYCGWEPVVCPEYENIAFHYGQCKRPLVQFRPGKCEIGDEPFAADVMSDDGTVIEGDGWDGCDFIEGRIGPIVTNRVVRWLIRHDFTPFVAKPCAVNVEGLDVDRLKIIEGMCAALDA